MEFFDIKKYILEKQLNAPVIFQQFPPILKWHFSAMTIDKLAEMLNQKKLKFRIGIFNPSSA